MPVRKPWPDAESVLRETVGWLEQIVIGLELCPFAKAVYVKGQVRYHVSDAETPQALLSDLVTELGALVAANPRAIDTTLLIHPRVLRDFLEYNDFLGVCELALTELGLDGVLQLASFHPDYRYAGNSPNDMANCVTRSPYPMLHLLRESSVERAVSAFPDPASIVTKNRLTLRGLGHEAWARLLDQALKGRS